MSMIDQTRFIERLQFFDGQRLFASDLQALETFNRELRWLHNQSFHQPGVGSGFAVTGEKGGRVVNVGAGYATDVVGRESILTQEEVLAIPPDAGNKGAPVFYDLTVSYPDDSGLEESETREGICRSRGTIRLREAPVFCWVELEGENFTPTKTKLRADLENGLKIRLARIEVLNCVLNARPSVALRQSARPTLTPYIASGFQRIKGVENFSIALPLFTKPEGRLRLITGTVDTSVAGFIATPEYSAHLGGPRQFRVDAANFAILDQTSVFDPARDKFEIQALVFVMPAAPTSSVMTDAQVAEVDRQITETWVISWMGVER
jgi:hypothetical protein